MNDGTELEGLVAAIEGSLAPAGVTVELRQPVFNDDGQQIAEFDVIIEGRIGSSSIKWLTECRDRPSSGSAPASWIEQLVGRRQRFRFDKVFAVSTTGFAPDAKRFAREQGIVLRSVSSVEEIVDDFGVVQFRLQSSEVHLQGYLDCLVNPVQIDLIKQLTQEQARCKGIKVPGEAAFWDARQFIRDHLNQSGQMPNPDDDQDFDLIFAYDPDLDVLFSDNRTLRVRKLRLPCRLRITHFPVTTVAGRVYAEDGTAIGQEVALTSETPAGSVRDDALIVSRPDGSVQVTLRRDYEFSPAESSDEQHFD